MFTKIMKDAGLTALGFFGALFVTLGAVGVYVVFTTPMLLGY